MTIITMFSSLDKWVLWIVCEKWSEQLCRQIAAPIRPSVMSSVKVSSFEILVNMVPLKNSSTCSSESPSASLTWSPSHSLSCSHFLLLRLIETEPVHQESSQSRGLLAAQIVASLQMLRYQLSSAVRKFVGGWLKEIFDGSGWFGFLFGWFILLPSLFVLLFLFTVFLTPFVALLFLVSFIFTAVFGIVTTSTVRPGASRHKEWSLVANGRLRSLWRHIRWLALHRLVLRISHPLRTNSLASHVLGHNSHPSHCCTNWLSFGHSGYRFMPKVWTQSPAHPRPYHNHSSLRLCAGTFIPYRTGACITPKSTIERSRCRRLDKICPAFIFVGSLLSYLILIPTLRVHIFIVL